MKRHRVMGLIYQLPKRALSPGIPSSGIFRVVGGNRAFWWRFIEKRSEY
jgi:hypothetical protein